MESLLPPLFVKAGRFMWRRGIAAPYFNVRIFFFTCMETDKHQGGDTQTHMVMPRKEGVWCNTLEVSLQRLSSRQRLQQGRVSTGSAHFWLSPDDSRLCLRSRVSRPPWHWALLEETPGFRGGVVGSAELVGVGLWLIYEWQHDTVRRGGLGGIVPSVAALTLTAVIKMMCPDASCWLNDSKNGVSLKFWFCCLTQTHGQN